MVIVPPSWEGDRNDLALEAARLQPNQFAVDGIGHWTDEAFGPQHLFWGTDLTRLPCLYRQAVTPFAKELDFFSAANKEWIMGRGIAEWLNWPLAKA